MDKEQVNTRLSDPLLEKIDERRKLLGKTRASYLALIAEQWYANNCPPVNDFEARVMEKHSTKRAS